MGKIVGKNYLDANSYYVKVVLLATAQTLVRQYHYAGGGANTATFAHGLFNRGDSVNCLGIAWWIPPTKTAAEYNYPQDWKSVLSLSRLVVVPGAPINAASFLLAGSIKLIKADGRWHCLVTYADEWQGHTGQIYRATNWEYAGLTRPERTYVDANGVMGGRKRGPKTLTNAQMLERGYTYVGSFSRHRFRKII